MPKIKINTFGEGIEIRQLQLESETYHHWNSIATRKNILLTDLLLDPFFYYGLKDRRYKELSDINANVVSGMVNTPKSLIEIWFNRRKVLKIQSQELFNEMLLFPLFKVEKNHNFLTNTLENGIYVVQKTIGLISSNQLEITSQQLSIDDFTFNMSEFNNHQLVAHIKYQNQNLNFIKNDTIITYQNAFEIK
ncbi:hypothetical protein [Flavobacterium ovatum]|uniref:hypothetical protein n=1 Tax=Flavobacterium ovatum TaxID=1928857 RepID=UPI00344EC0B2